MLTARDTSNLYLADQVRAKDRLKALSATTHINADDDYIEIVAYIMAVCITWTACILVWVLS